MSLKIRLRQQGKKNRYVYRLVLTESRAPRDGKYLEMLGWYNPFGKDEDKTLNVLGDRVQYWLDKGAIVTESAQSLIKKICPQVISAYKQRQVEKQKTLCEKRKALKKKKESAKK